MIESPPNHRFAMSFFQLLLVPIVTEVSGVTGDGSEGKTTEKKTAMQAKPGTG